MSEREDMGASLRFDQARMGNLRSTIALILDANYHTAISKALSTADKIIAAIEAMAKPDALNGGSNDQR